MNEESLRKAIDKAHQLIAQATQPLSLIKPTDFFCEGWLVSFVLELAAQKNDVLPFSFAEDAVWGREMGLRPVPGFRVGTTWADGVVGHIGVRPRTKRGLCIAKDAKQLVVIEAKINSPLALGTRHAKGFDQAARSVVAMAIELHRHGLCVEQFDSLALVVASPKEYIETHLSLVTKESVLNKFRSQVKCLASSDKKESERFEEESLTPLLHRMGFHCITWEQVIKNVREANLDEAGWLLAFYNQTREFAKSARYG